MKSSLRNKYMPLVIAVNLIAAVLFIFTVKSDMGYILPSFLVLFVSIVPFLMIYEKKSIRTREVVLISVMSAIAVLGRVLLFFFPEVKATGAIVIIAGIALGPQAGFLVGVIAAFVSNFFFGQGIWVIWQMFGFGMVGALAGLLMKNKENRLWISIMGFLLVFVVYGLIVNMQSLIMYATEINIKSIIAIYVPAIPFDLVHGLSTAVFLWFLANPFFEKLTRIKEKYGMIDFR